MMLHSEEAENAMGFKLLHDKIAKLKDQRARLVGALEGLIETTTSMYLGRIAMTKNARAIIAEIQQEDA